LSPVKSLRFLPIVNVNGIAGARADHLLGAWH